MISLCGRLKNRAIPKVPVRDYGDDEFSDDQFSDPEYDNDTYEDPNQDNSYEPPPSERSFPVNPPFSKGEYLDSFRKQPAQPPRKPFRPGKTSRQLPPEPTDSGSDKEDYMSPDGHNDDDNYIEPEEHEPSKPPMHCRRRETHLPFRSPHTPEASSSPDFFEVLNEEIGSSSSSSSPSRRCLVSSKSTLQLPPKPSPRVNKTSPPTPPDPTSDEEYAVCDGEEDCDTPTRGRPPLLPNPLPRERSPKPPVRPNLEVKPRRFESHSLPVMQTNQKVLPKVFSLDITKPKIPVFQFASKNATERRRGSADNGTKDDDKSAGVMNKPWYASACDRKTAEEVLIQTNKDGAFMVRKSSGLDVQQPYTLVVFYGGKVYNIPIRLLANTQQYALGREKKGEEYFNSIAHIVENHQRTPLVLIDSQNNSKDSTKLCFPVTP
uniref:SH2 domain-containing protein n=1 Tax=Cynoglossus semilaevis TaxID=244447 RepID=A0A3P8VHL9_CYNSE